MSALSKKISKAAKFTVSRIAKRVFAFVTVLAVIFSSLGAGVMTIPIAHAAIAEGAAPTELLFMPTNTAKANAVVAVNKITVIQASGADTLTSIKAVLNDVGASGLASADFASIALRKESGANVGFQNGEDLLVAGAIINSPTIGAGIAPLTPTAPEAISTTPVIYYIVVTIAASPTNNHTFSVSMPANYAVTSAGPVGTALTSTKTITIDTAAPTLNSGSSFPSNGASNVPISTIIHMGFSENMAFESVSAPGAVTLMKGAVPVGANVRPVPDGFDVVVSNPPTYAVGSNFAKVSGTSSGFYKIFGTSPINIQGSYNTPVDGDIVYFQHGTFPAEFGVVTAATTTAGTFKVNDFTLFGEQMITKFATPTATGLAGSATALTVGDLVVANMTANPTSDRYGWHIVTAGTAVNDAALRLDNAAAAPTLVASSRVSSLTPTDTSAVNGTSQVVGTAGGGINFTIGDLVFAKVTANADNLNSYAWHTVTVAENITTNAAPTTLRLDSAAAAPTFAASSMVSKIDAPLNGAASDPLTAFSMGDIVMAKTTANAANNDAYNFHLVTNGATGANNAALRFDNAASTLDANSSYTVTSTTAITDMAGNPLAADAVVAFTTSSTGSTNTTPPFVQSSTPQAGNQAFPTGVPLKVQFSVSMNITAGAAGANSVLNPSNVGIFPDNYGAPGTLVSGITNTYDDATRTVTLTPSPALADNTSYILKIAPIVQSATGTMMNEFRIYFKTSGADTVKPRVLGMYPTNLATSVAKNAVISIGFSEDMNPSTINSSNITIDNGAVGTISYSPGNKTAFFTPSQPFINNTAYTVTVSSSATDLSGLALDQDTGTVGNQNFTSGFTTGSAAIPAPSVMSANADNFGVAITFSQAMKVGAGPNAADNIANYSLESPVGSSISLGGKTVAYDGSTTTAKISGLSLQNGSSYKVTVGNLTQDISGTGIATGGSPAGNIAQGTVSNAAMTGGQLGPGSGPMQTGGQMGMTPMNVMPMNRAAGATSNYSVEFPVTTSIPAGGSIVLTFPTGFDVTNAAKATAGTESFRNGDINGPMSGIVTMGVLANNASARTITIPTAGDATGANAFLSFDLKAIVNTTLPSDTGYTVDIKTKGTDGAILETKTSNPFFLGQTGTNTLTVNVFNDNGAGSGIAGNNTKDGTEAGIQNAVVFLFSPSLGGQSATTNAGGVATFASLSNGDYMLGLEPKSVGGGGFAFNSAPQPMILSGNATRNFGLAAAPYTITGTVYGPASTAIDVFASSMNGFVKASVTTNSTPVTYNSVSYGGSVTYTLPVQANTIYQVGVGPAMPDSMMMPGAPPPSPPTFTFMPPPNQEIAVAGASVPNKNFTLSSADKTITGTVKDSAGAGINGVMVFARPVSSSTVGGSNVGMGTGGQTDAAGNFTLKVVAGTYLVGAFKPGMPGLSDRQIFVPSSGANVPASLDFVMDFNSSSSLTIGGTIKDDSGNAIPYAGVSGRKVVSTVDTTPVGGGGDNFVGGPTNANGGYTLYVSAGIWVVEAFAPGFGKLGTKTITVGTASMTGQDFSAQTMSLGTITGQAVKDSVAQQGVMVRVEGSNGGNMTVTDVSGNYSIKVPAGIYNVKCMFPGVGESTPLTGVVVAEDGTTANQNCSLAAPITITVNLTDGTNPISNAFVDARDSNGRGNGTGSSTISGINAVYVLTVPPGTYTVRAGHPAYGMVGSTANVSSTQAITYTASAGRIYAVTGTVTGDGGALSGAWVSLHGTSTGQTNIVHLGGQTNSSGIFSISIPDGVYRYRADKPGYKSPAEGTVTVNGATIDVGTIALTIATRTITGTVTLSGSGVSNAFVDASDGAGGFAVSQTDTAGAYSLAVDNGTWTVRAHSMGYEGGPSSVTVNNNSPSGQAIALSAIAGFTIRPEKQETMTPTSGGFLTNSDIGTSFKLNIPANALGTSSNASTVTTQTNTAVPTPPTGSVLSKNAIKISAVDSSGQPIKTLNDDVTLTVPYTEADIPAGSSENSLVLGVWNEATQSYDTLSTIVDATNNTLTATTSHFSDFAPLLAGSGAPSTPTGLAATAASTSQINLTWTATSGATSYDIYRSTSLGGTYSRLGVEPTVAAVTSYSDTTGLSAGTAYYYKISALNASGESAASSAVTATTNSAASSGGGGGGGDINPPTNTSIVIASGASSTASRSVTLTLAATDASQMMISNTLNFTGDLWETYATSKAWTLVSGNGTKTVYAKFKDASGNASSAVSDTITLNESLTPTSTPATPATPATPGVSPATPASPSGVILYRAEGDNRVYVVKDGKKSWIKSAEEFNSKGYKWTNIVVTSPAAVAAFPDDTGTPAVSGAVALYRAEGDFKVYAVSNGVKQWIKTATEFNSKGYKWTNIVVTAPATVASLPDGTVAADVTVKVVGTATLRVRKSNTTRSAVLGNVKRNATFTVLEENAGWYKITLPGGVIGWISGLYAAKQ